MTHMLRSMPGGATIGVSGALLIVADLATDIAATR
jgi:hypothetical protein